MTTYTLIGDGEPRSGLTAEELGREILSADGHTWEVRPEGNGWRLYRSRFSAASTLGARQTDFIFRYYSHCENEADAMADLLAQVGRDGPCGWRGCANWDAMPDDDYRALCDEIEREEQEDAKP